MGYSNPLEEAYAERQIIQKCYEEMLVSAQDGTRRDALIAELLAHQNPNGFWCAADPADMDSEARVDFLYYPTYYATAALICADLCADYPEESEVRAALDRGLRAAMGRKLSGHGYDGESEMLKTLSVYRLAGLHRWIRVHRNYSHPFSCMIRELLKQMQWKVGHLLTVGPWGENYREAYLAEIDASSDQRAGRDFRYVWYAAYGSNINRERFMRYIIACTDQTPPAEDRPYRFPHSMYFAKSSVLWHGGGKAFLDDTCTGEAYGRIYQITREQFAEVKKMEGRDYQKQLFLGEIDGLPVYSFTDTQKHTEVTVPSDDYFQTILDGIAECWSGTLDRSEAAAYLAGRIFPPHAFAAAKAIREAPHVLTNDAIGAATGVTGEAHHRAIRWLLEHGVIQQDGRSIRAGHRVTDGDAGFYTVDDHSGRGLMTAILQAMQPDQAK